MKKELSLFIAALSASWMLVAAESAVSDTEVWNEGVDCYFAGDVTNALRLLKPLTLSGEYAARSSEVVAKLLFERSLTNGVAGLEGLEEAARCAQTALRANPADARANRNFTRTVDRLPELREAARIERVLKENEGKDPGALIGAATAEARALMRLAPTIATNRAERKVALADACATRARRVADVWIPVRRLIAESVTNEEQAATIVAQLDAAQAKTARAAVEFGDLDPEAYASVAEVERDLTRFLKLTVLPPAAIAEDIVAQSNAWQDVEEFNGRSWQRDALDYTRAFRQKFPAWARAYEQQAAADTNREPFTAEAQAHVSALATELEKIQLECCEKLLPPEQEKAIQILNEINELLPKDKNGGQGQQNQQSNQNQQPNGSEEPNPPQEPKDQEGPERADGDQPQTDEETDPKDDSGKEDGEDKDIEAVLKKAQERSDEHEADKKARMRKAPLPPNERDW